MEAPVVRAAALALALAACAHPHVDLDREMAHAIDQVMVTSGTWAEVDDPPLRAYVRTVGMRLVRAAGDHRTWRFRVVDDPAIQGEANTGTTIYVTRGAIARLRDEAELAGLLGHEIGHVIAGHAHDALVETMRDVPVETHDRDRDDEVQADELAVLLTARAGYDPRAVETMLRALAAGSPAGDDTATHPPWPQRLARVGLLAAQLPAGGARNAAAFLAHARTIVDGEDPRIAAMVGDTLVLAHAGAAIDLPHGTQVELADRQVIAALAGHAVIIKPISRELARYLTPSSEADKVTVVRRTPHGAVMIAVAGPSPMAALGSLSLRTPRAEELSRIKPTLVDLTAPRKLWPE
jgi:predicted Zn-dependent protease